MPLAKRNKFSLSHYKLLSCNQGFLIPITWYEALPGDTIQQSTSLFVRSAPLVAPIMHPVHVKVHHWFVPLRLIWEDFEDFITGGDKGTDTTVYPHCARTENGVKNSVLDFTVGSLADYLGLPIHRLNTGSASKIGAFSWLPFRAYNLIYNEWYRDQDLQEPVPTSTKSGALYPSIDSTTNTAIQENTFLQRVDWERDYFTTSRPWPQKGPSVTVPTSAANTLPGTVNNSAGISIQQLREGFALQKFAEHRAMYGSRYVEYLRYLGVKASDARLQRPEYLGGGKQTLQFSEVLQTAPSGTGANETYVGTMRGHGVAGLKTNRYRRFFEEHGIVMSLMMINPVAIYIDGYGKEWRRETRTDYFQRELQHIGQEPVYTRELYALLGATQAPVDTEIFGYQNRYDSYRWIKPSVAGEFRTTLNYWHMARDFSNKPALNSSFITCEPTDRIYASTKSSQLYVMASHSIQARRMMSKQGNPI